MQPNRSSYHTQRIALPDSPVQKVPVQQSRPAVDAAPPFSTGPRVSRDQVRWGPIVAGMMATLTALFLFSVLGVAVGATAVNAGAITETPTNASFLPTAYSVVTGILSFFLGGLLAGYTAAVVNRRWAAVNGMMVFVLAIPVTLLLASPGIDALLGSAATFASGMNIDPAAIQVEAPPAPPAQPTEGAPAEPAPPAAAVQRAREIVRDRAWGTLAASLLGLVAAAAGGAAGGWRERDETPVNPYDRD